MFKEQYWEDRLADSCLDSQMLGVMRTKIAQNCANVRERGGKCVRKKKHWECVWQRDDWPGLLLTNAYNNGVGVDVVDRYGVDYKIRLLCFRRRAGGHFEVDYNASVMLIIMMLFTKYDCCSQAPSWWTACSMWWGRRARAAIAFR